ncbi:MAG: hypothetical protein LBJ08_01515 [Bifidobacteriaceae bacterium]|jgi:hypothetical protein|nr:hypothetical protein [Bifidobacteriaceae bacterium]
MSRKYRRRTDRVPQDERHLSVASEDNPLDLEALANMFVMHALGQRFRDQPEADRLMGLNLHLPHNRASMPAA